MRIIGRKRLALYIFLGKGVYEDCDYDGAVSAFCVSLCRGYL